MQRVIQVCNLNGNSLSDCEYIPLDSLVLGSGFNLDGMMPVITALCSLMAIVWTARIIFKLLIKG